MMNNSEIMSVMELLQWKEVTTKRQRKNGTREFELPIKSQYGGRKLQVASFESGYVRVQNSGDRAYQLNKRCEGEPQYFETSDGLYRKWTTRTCKLIPIEIDRLEYLISYCLKNYYIKNANSVAEGKYVPKWRHEYELERVSPPVVGNVSVNINGQRYKVI